MKKRYMVFHDDIDDDEIGVEFKRSQSYEIISEDDKTYYIDYDKENQINLKKDAKINKYGFPKSLEGDIFEII